MNGPSRPIDMSTPSRWLALLRVVVGLYFAKAIWTKMTVVMLGGFLPAPVVQDRWIESMPKVVEKQAAENPITFYKNFLDNTVLPNSPVFAKLTAVGEVIVGTGLTLGLFCGAASLGGLFLVVNYGLATQWMSPGQRGFHLVLAACMLVFFLARAGRAYGMDGWLAWRFPDAFFTRRPFA